MGGEVAQCHEPSQRVVGLGVDPPQFDVGRRQLGDARGLCAVDAGYSSDRPYGILDCLVGGQDRGNRGLLREIEEVVEVVGSIVVAGQRRPRWDALTDLLARLAADPTSDAISSFQFTRRAYAFGDP